MCGLLLVVLMHACICSVMSNSLPPHGQAPLSLKFSRQEYWSFIGKGASSPKLEGAGISNTSFEVLRMERSWIPTSLSHWVALLIQYQLSMSQAAKNPLRRRVSLRQGLQYKYQAGPGR